MIALEDYPISKTLRCCAHLMMNRPPWSAYCPGRSLSFDLDTSHNGQVGRAGAAQHKSSCSFRSELLLYLPIWTRQTYALRVSRTRRPLGCHLCRRRPKTTSVLGPICCSAIAVHRMIAVAIGNSPRTAYVMLNGSQIIAVHSHASQRLKVAQLE